MTADAFLPEKPGKYFTWNEFKCNDRINTPYPLDWRTTRGVLLGVVLDQIRERIGAFSPTSVYRTWANHKQIYADMKPPQAPPTSSQHLYGRAADVPCPETMDWDTFVSHIEAVAKSEGSKVRYVRFYRRQRFAHVDIRNTASLKIDWEV